VKIALMVKEVPEAAVPRKLTEQTKRLEVVPKLTELLRSRAG
jgi:hypothetical protein